MPFKSQFPLVDIPDLDLWTFLFERTDRPFPDDKGGHAAYYSPAELSNA